MNLIQRPAHDITIAAHRGASQRYPENSLAAIKEAINIGMEHPHAGFFIEVDVRKTADHFLVLMHDTEVSRTTRGQGRVEDTRLDALQKLAMRDISEIIPHEDQKQDPTTKPFFPVGQEDLKVPTLAEVMALVQHANQHRKRPIGLALDIKSEHPNNHPVNLTKRSMFSGLSEILDFFGLTNSSDIVSPPSEISQHLAALLNHITSLPPLLIFTSEGMAGKRDLEEVWQHAAPHTKNQLSDGDLNISTPTLLVDKSVKNPTTRIAMEAIQHGKRFWAMGEASLMPLVSSVRPRDSEASIATAIEGGANFINSNHPGRALKALEAIQQHAPKPHRSPYSFAHKERVRQQDTQQEHGFTA